MYDNLGSTQILFDFLSLPPPQWWDGGDLVVLLMIKRPGFGDTG